MVLRDDMYRKFLRIPRICHAIPILPLLVERESLIGLEYSVNGTSKFDTQTVSNLHPIHSDPTCRAPRKTADPWPRGSFDVESFNERSQAPGAEESDL